VANPYKRFFGGLAGILLIGLLYLVSNRIFPGSFKLLRLFLIAGIMFVVMIFFRRYVVREKNFPPIIRNVFTSVIVIFLMFMICESAFLFVARTHQFMPAFANLTWYRRFDRPVNSQGFRDSEHDSADTTRKKIFFIGDSFVAGSGIENNEDRFQEICGKKLGEKFEIFTLALGGAETKREFTFLENAGQKPGLIVLSWHPNDILGAGNEHGLGFEFTWNYDDLNPVSAFVITHSYSLEYLYWSFPHGDFSDYQIHLENLYNNPEILQQHLKDLQKFIGYADENQSGLMVMIWPTLGESKNSSKMTEPVIRFFQQKGIPVLDLHTYFPDHEFGRYVQNVNDAHPNETSHKIAGNALNLFIRENINLRSE